MNNKSEVIIDNKSNVLNIISWLFGIAVLAIGVINTFWGNDPGFGVFLVLLSFVYFPPVNSIIRKRVGFGISGVVKIILGIFIIWAAIGVGELSNKIDLMIGDNTPSMNVSTSDYFFFKISANLFILPALVVNSDSK